VKEAAEVEDIDVRITKLSMKGEGKGHERP